METRRLGRTGFEVSTLAIGTAGLDASRWRDLDPRAAQRVVYEALEAGLTLVDTSPAWGEAERLVGEVIRDLRARDRVVVVTELPACTLPGGAPAQRLEQAFPPGYVVHAVESCLRVQRAEVLPVARLGRWRDAWVAEPCWTELVALLHRLIKEGKVLHWGATLEATSEPTEREREEREEPAPSLFDQEVFGCVQLPGNLLEPAPEALLARAADRDLGVIACSPLAAGALGGQLDAETHFAPGDWRAQHFDAARWRTLGPALERWRRLLGDEVRGLPELALRVLAGDRRVTTVTAGMRQREHLRANLAAFGGPALSAELEARIAELRAAPSG